MKRSLRQSMRFASAVGVGIILAVLYWMVLYHQWEGIKQALAQ